MSNKNESLKPDIIVKMDEEKKDFYLKLRKKIKDWINSKEGKNHEWAEYLLLAPDLFHLLVKLSMDKRIPTNAKIKFGLGISYFILPLDLFPELIFGPVGYLDDIAVTAFILHNYINGNEHIVEELWAGEGNILEVVKTVLNKADQMLGSGLWTKIKKKFS